MSSEISRCRTQDNRVSKLSKKGRVDLCVVKAHIRKQSLRKLLCSFYARILLFSPWALRAPKYHFAGSTTTVLGNCFKKGRVELCVMKSHNRKQSLRKLLCGHYVRIFPFLPWAPRAPKYHFAVSTKRELANCLLRNKLEHCWMNSQNTEKFLRKLLLRF